MNFLENRNHLDLYFINIFKSGLFPCLYIDLKHSINADTQLAYIVLLPPIYLLNRPKKSSDLMNMHEPSHLWNSNVLYIVIQN